MNFLFLFKFLILEIFGLTLAIVALVILLFLILRKSYSMKMAIVLLLLFLGVFIFFFVPRGLPEAFQYPFQIKTFGPASGPGIPLPGLIGFFRNLDEFLKVDNIAENPANIPEDIQRTENSVVEIELEAKEVISEIAPGISMNYWTFNGTVPGPFLRILEGDTVKLTLRNAPESLHHHSIDLHAVTGSGGGASVTHVGPGEQKTLTFKALNPGLYVYHCAAPNVATHMTHGMYGLILVEPKDGLPIVDKEFYIMQGELYTAGLLGKGGLQIFDANKMLNSDPEYVVFNGKTGSLVDNMEVNVGDRVRFFVGNGGVNLTSSFHLIGEIFDRVYPEGAIGSLPLQNVQTTLVPAGGASIAEFTADVPGKYILVDHALARLDRGAWGVLEVVGESNPEIYDGELGSGHGH